MRQRINTMATLSIPTLTTLMEAQAALHASMSTDKVVVLYFTGEFCGPCKRIKPTVLELADTYASQLSFYMVDIETTPLVAHFAVKSVPTFVFIRRNIIIHTQTGADASLLELTCRLMAKTAFPEIQ